MKEVEIKVGKQRFWIFQANPERFRIFDWFSVVGEIDDWSVNQYPKEIKKGDLTAIWVAQGKAKDEIAGIYAIAEIVTNPEMILQDPKEIEFWVNEEDRKEFSENPRLQVKIRYVKKFIDHPLLRTSIRNDPILSGITILKYAHQTNFTLTNRQWQRIVELVKPRS